MNYKRYTSLVFIIIIIAIATGILDYYLPAMGDDLKKWSYLGLDEYNLFSRDTIKFIAGHIVGSNGRLFDWLGPVLINCLPRIVIALIMGCMMGLYLLSMLINLPLKSNNWFYILYIGIIISVMPWWDSMWLRVCHYNYIWSTLFDLLYIYFFFKKTEKKISKWTIFGLFILSFFAGAGHEMNGVSMSVAMMIWYFLHGRKEGVARCKRAMIVGLFIGTFTTVAVPSIWHRVASETLHDNLIHLLWTTLPVFIILVLTCIIVYSIPRSREKFKEFIGNEVVQVMVIVATVAAFIALISGIPGRTGWLTESLSIILFARLVLLCDFKIKSFPAVLITFVATAWIVIHYIVTIQWQARVYSEFEEVKTKYIQSTDGIVFYDYTSRYEVSPLTLYRVKGIPDADDKWLSYVMRMVYGNETKEFIVLPTNFENQEFQDSIVVDYYAIYKEKPLLIIAEPDSLMIQVTNNGLNVVNELPQGWFSRPLVQDPGDLVVIRDHLEL